MSNTALTETKQKKKNKKEKKKIRSLAFFSNIEVGMSSPAVSPSHSRSPSPSVTRRNAAVSSRLNRRTPRASSVSEVKEQLSKVGLGASHDVSKVGTNDSKWFIVLIAVVFSVLSSVVVVWLMSPSVATSSSSSPPSVVVHHPSAEEEKTPQLSVEDVSRVVDHELSSRLPQWEQRTKAWLQESVGEAAKKIQDHVVEENTRQWDQWKEQWQQEDLAEKVKRRQWEQQMTKEIESTTLKLQQQQQSTPVSTSSSSSSSSFSSFPKDFSLSIDSSFTSPTLGAPSPTWSFLLRAWGFRLAPLTEPMAVLRSPPPRRNSCWMFKGSNGTLAIRLRQPTLVGSVSLWHTHWRQSHFDRNYPRDFSVSIRVGNDWKLLGSFTYDAYGAEMQMFHVEDHNTESDLVLFEFLNNTGDSTFTCIQNVGVHAKNEE